MIFLKFARNLIKTVFFCLTAFCILVFSFVLYIGGNINRDFKIKKGETLNISSPVPVTAVYKGTKLS